MGKIMRTLNGYEIVDDYARTQIENIETDMSQLSEQITTSKVSVSDIVDDYVTNVSNKPVSAAVAVKLKALIDAITVPTLLSQLGQDATHRTVTDAEKEIWNKNTTDIADLQGEVKALTSAKAEGNTLEEQIGWLNANGDTTKEYLLLDNHYYAYTQSGELVYTNLFSFEDADENFSWVSGSSANMIYQTSSDFGYKDTENNRFVSKKTMNDGRYAVTGGIANLPNGDYTVSAEVFVPNDAPNLFVQFGVCLIPNNKSAYKQYSISSKGKWETISYDFTVASGNSYTYVAMMGGSANTAEIYWRNVKVISKNDAGTYSYAWTKTDKSISSVGSGGKKWASKKWVAFGDSLTEANERTTKHYHDYISEETGINVVNMGESGSGFKREFDSNTAFYQRILNVPTDADVVTIFGSGNDLSTTWNTYGLGEVTDTGTDTICGCINKTIDNLYSVLPTVQLGIITPTPWDCFYPSATADPQNRMSLYSEKIVEICKRRSIPCLDLYHCSGLRPWETSFKALAYSKDDGGGTHPDETGHSIIASRIKAFLESLI